MKYFRFHLKANKKLLLYALWFSLCIDLIIIAADLGNIGVEGFMVPIIACLAVTALIMLAILFIIYRGSKKNEPQFDMLEQKGVCDEFIDFYKQRHPKMSPINHVILGTYLSILGRYDEAEYEISIAGNYFMADVMTKAYYCCAFIMLRIRQRRFDEAIIMYNNYDSMMTAYCRSNKNAICVDHYSQGALLYAYSGDFQSAMVCVQSMDKAVRKNRKFAFTRNTALMGVYLLMGDYSNADSVKSMMLRDLPECDAFDFKYEKDLVRNDIDEITQLFDPRVQTQKG